MGVSQSSTRCILWAAQDGRLNDLVYHLKYAKSEALEPSSLAPKGRAAIHLAAAGGHSSCVQVLLEAGSKLDGLAGDGYSPLHLAVANSHYNCVLTLLHLGANANIRNRFNITPLHIATSIGHTPCMETLVKCLADIDSQESWGQTPLIIATLKARVHCMRALIFLGANTEVKDHQHHRTALHIACTVRDEETLLILLDARANLLTTDSSGQSSLGLALENKFYHAVPLLVEYGAKLNGKDRESMSTMLEDHLDNLAGSPLSLLRLCRVKVRRMIGPASLDKALPSLQLSDSLLEFVLDVRAVCEGGGKVKQVSLQGVLAEHHKRERHRTQQEKESQSRTGEGVAKEQWTRCEVQYKHAYVV